MKSLNFLLLILPLVFFSCMNKAQVKDEKIKKEQTLTKLDLQKKETPSFEVSFFVTNATKKSNTEFYSLEYTLSVTAVFPQEAVFIEYELFDTEDILLKEGSVGKDNLQTKFSENINFSSYLNYKNIKYKIICKNKNDEITNSFTGECTNSNYPSTLEFGIASVNTDFINNSRSVSQTFFCNVETTDDVVLDKVRIIPPAKDFYWDVIPDTINKNNYKAISIIKDSTHNDYLECGEYHVQFLFGKNGIIQDTFLLKDLYGNDSGPNYGAASLTVQAENLNEIEWDLQNLSQLQKMTLFLYEKNNTDTPFACYNFAEPTTKCKKKDLLHALQNDENTQKKIKFNKKYLYQIKLEFQNNVDSNEKGEVKYISTSPFYEITFYGFNPF